MTSNELLYVKGARVWLPHPATVWEGASLETDYKKGDTVLNLLKETGEKYELKLKKESDLPPLRNPSVLIGQNDLTALSYLHEPAVLNNLEVRFRQKQAIYTYCGIVLVAINPYADLPLYGSDIIRAYRGHSMGELEPHIFAVAEEAYAKLEREKCNLSIIVSGESGAGKTVSAKYAMRYFAAVGGSESETQIERKVLASSPIMEAIGNAKTTRNDNSSRFGKFTKLLFKNDLGTMTLTGATMQTYLLEKSRVVFQAIGERNYHIFYQLCAARDQWPELILDHQDKFRYLNFGKSPDINKISDLEQFNETVRAFHTLGFNSQETGDIMKILAAILHLGNIKLDLKYKRNTEEIDQDGCDISPNDLHLNIVAEILRISSDELRKWLVMRKIESVNEYVHIPNNITTAEAARDALAKHMYAKLFQYIVGVMNKSLNCGKTQNCFIGVLDIYGFETFETNSFEQFCINYANEKLQQQFNQHVFTLEQEEYLKEGIVWRMIDFYDNQPCIDLIESKLGILDLLDEECKMPKGSDDSWAEKLYDKCTKYKHFERPRFGYSSFLVKHFSDTVVYDVCGFLEKNRDTVSKELVNVIRLSEMNLCKKLMNVDDADALNEGKTSLGGRVVISASKSQLPLDKRRRALPSKSHKQSVGSQFRDSLNLLITTLHATTPHYVRCIKPNDDKAPFKWEAPKIVQQLRACGVLETVRISAAGFPSRWAYLDFYNRYRLLCTLNQTIGNDLKSTCQAIVLKWITDEDKYRFGHTQIFFRAGQVAYLEQVRTNIRRKYIIIVQSAVRKFVYRRWYLRLQKVVLGVQRYARGLLARRKAREIRENRAAITIQRYMRGWYARLRYYTIRRAVCGMQQCARGMLARQKFKNMLDNYRATQIQRFCRGYLARQSFQRKLNSLVKCQSLVRAFLARRLYKRMKAEAKTISHMQKMYKGLENKIISLQQRIDEISKENTILKIQNAEIPELRRQIETKKNLENDLKLLKLQLIEKENSIMSMRKQIDVERDEKLTILDEKDREAQEWNDQKQTWRLENEELKKQVDEMIEMAKREQSVTTNRTRLLSEIDNNEVHQAYQRALKDKEILEIENHSLKEELRRIQRPNGNIMEYSSHSRSLSNASSQNEEDYGYSSAKNTLDLKRNNQIDHNESVSTEAFGKIDNTSTPKSSHTTLILKLRKVLEEEKNKNKSLSQQLHRWKGRKPLEDSLRASELEVENDRLRQDYESLRTSIKHGVHQQELQAQFMALQEELNRRREECLQLRTVLAEQSQSIKSFGGVTNNKDLSSMPGGELAEAFQAQKVANRLLEAELKALTEENNARFAELTKQFEDLKTEKIELQTILQNSLQNYDEENIETLRRNEQYLRHELEKAYTDFIALQEEMNILNNKLSELTRSNHALSTKLREYGGAETIVTTDDQKMLSVKKETAQTFQGFFKYNEENLDMIFQRLITDITPRVAIGLLPGLPAYIIFMCIRYTDLLNEDNRVKTLLTKFVLIMKKFYRLPNSTEIRVVWLVNSLTLHNLLKQYGGIEEFKYLNTESQNQQQLNHFDLSEYRQVVYDIIVNIYRALVVQIQTSIKQLIVPAVLEHDEMGTGTGKGRTLSLDSSPNKQSKAVPKLRGLLNQLEIYRKQFQLLSLDNFYIEQIMKQLMYYICAVSMNTLMLSGKLCMWKTGMRIRYNTGCLKEWAREKKLANDVLTPLIPLTEASCLLQARKSEEDVDSLMDMCTNLSSAQVLKIIKSYNADDCESRISNAFIDKLTDKLYKKYGNVGKDTFTMEENDLMHISVVYKYSDIQLEKIELPKSLKLDGLLEKA